MMLTGEGWLRPLVWLAVLLVITAACMPLAPSPTPTSAPTPAGAALPTDAARLLEEADAAMGQLRSVRYRVEAPGSRATIEVLFPDRQRTVTTRGGETTEVITIRGVGQFRRRGDQGWQRETESGGPFRWTVARTVREMVAAGKATARVAGEEVLAGVPTVVVEVRSPGASTGAAEVRLWLGKEDRRVRRVEELASDATPRAVYTFYDFDAPLQILPPI